MKYKIIEVSEHVLGYYLITPRDKRAARRWGEPLFVSSEEDLRGILMIGDRERIRGAYQVGLDLFGELEALVTG